VLNLKHLTPLGPKQMAGLIFVADSKAHYQFNAIVERLAPLQGA